MKIKRSVQAKFESDYFVQSEIFLVKLFILPNNSRGMSDTMMTVLSEMEEKERCTEDLISEGKA